MITRRDIEAAADRIAPRIRATPTIWIEEGTLAPVPVALKLEQLQHTGSFKVRGAFNAMLAEPVPPAGVVAVSGGNHGAAVAYAATQLGHPSAIHVPSFAGPVKMARMRKFGTEVIEGEDDVDALVRDYEAHAARTGARTVHPYDDPLVMAGQGTLAKELEDQAGGLDTVIVSVGGGGLIGGVAAWFGGTARIVAVETEGTATYAATLLEGPGTSVRATGIAASSLGASTMGGRAMAQLAACDALSIVVTDAEVKAAQASLWEEVRLVVEPGAAVALAALTSGRYKPGAAERVGVVVCGGNASVDWFID